GLYLHRLSWRARRGDNRLGSEVERHTEDVGIFGVEQIVFVEFVRLTTERAADHLFAEQLRAERADAENMGNVVGIPAFGAHRDGAGQRLAGRLVEVVEEREPTMLQLRQGRVVLVIAVEAGDVVVHQLRDGGVLADDDEAWRNGDTALLPQLERLLVVPVQRLERGPEPRRQLQRIELPAGAAPLLRHVVADVLPEVAVDRHLLAGDVL